MNQEGFANKHSTSSRLEREESSQFVFGLPPGVCHPKKSTDKCFRLSGRQAYQAANQPAVTERLVLILCENTEKINKKKINKNVFGTNTWCFASRRDVKLQNNDMCKRSVFLQFWTGVADLGDTCRKSTPGRENRALIEFPHRFQFHLIPRIGV